MIVPDAFDLTSMISIGSTVPFACALSTMLRRSTAAVSIVTEVSVVFLHAPTTSTMPSAISLSRSVASFIRCSRSDEWALLQILPNQRFQLRPRDPVVVTGLNQRLLRCRQRSLRRNEVEEHGRADVVTLLLHAHILLRRRDGSRLHSHPLRRTA